MNIATIDPSLSTTSTSQLKPWARRVSRTSRTTGRVLAIAAVLSLPLVSAGAATAEPAPAHASVTTTSTLSKAAIEQRELEQARAGSQTGGHATQQQTYLDRLKRDAAGAAESDASAGTGFAAQQRAYVDQLAQAADAIGDGSAASDGRTAFAAQQQAYVDVLAHAAQAAGSGGDAAQFAASGTDDSGDGVPVPVAVLLGIGGMALGTGVAIAARRVRFPQRRLAV